MADAKLEATSTLLDYLKVILTGPVMFSLVAMVFIFCFKEDIKALLLRIAKIKLPGGTEVSTPQSTRVIAEEKKNNTPTDTPNLEPIQGLPTDLNSKQKEAVEQIIRSQIATSYLWEYRYLSYYLVRNTQEVLDWFSGLSQPTTYSLFDTTWLPLVPSAKERQSIYGALESHHLIQIDNNGLICVTPKGKEYIQWRGPLPPLSG